MSAAPAPPATVLCVDDEKPLLRVIAKQVEKAGFRALTAEDGHAALELALREKPDLILSDWMMPVMDGIELCRRVRASEELRSVYFVVLTAKDGTRDLVEALSAGADDFLTKPFAHDELMARLRAGARTVRLHRELAESQRALFRAEKMASLGVMAGGVAHEFNNIFGAIVGYCELALERDDPERTRQALRVTLESAERAAAITRNLLGFAREQPPSLMPVDLVQCLDQVLEIVNPGLRKRNISVTRVADAAGPARGDAAQLHQVLFNLIQNAEHAMEEGGTLTVTVGSADGGRSVQVAVADTGIGIPAENLPRVFEPFFTTKGAYGGGSGRGTGLGLSVVHGIVQAHGGEITLESAEGRGTTVTVKLPVWAGDAQAAAGADLAQLEEPAPAVPAEPLSILAVDDEPPILEILKEMLEGLGHSVALAHSVDEAVKAFKSRPFSLVFADVIMPGKNGWELLAELRAIKPDVAVVFVTGSIGKDTFSQARQMGAAGCIYKPFHIRDIRKLLAEFAAGRVRKPIAIRLMPDLHGENCEAMSRLVLDCLRGSSRDLELDLGNVGYLPSRAVGCMVSFYSELSQSGRRLILTNVSDQVFETLDLAGITGLPFQNLEIRRQTYGRRRAARK